MGVLEVKKFIVSTALFPNLKKKSVDNKLYFSIFSSNRNLSQCTMAISTKATRISWPVWSKDHLYFVLYNFEPGFSDISDIKFPKNFLFLDFIAKMSPGNGKTSCGCHHHKIAIVRGCSHRLERCNGPGHPGIIRHQTPVYDSKSIHFALA